MGTESLSQFTDGREWFYRRLAVFCPDQSQSQRVVSTKLYPEWYGQRPASLFDGIISENNIIRYTISYSVNKILHLMFFRKCLKVLFCWSCIEVKVFRIVNKNIIIPLLKLLFPITEGFKLDSILDFETEKRLEKREESWLLWLVDVETH